MTTATKEQAPKSTDGKSSAKAPSKEPPKDVKKDIIKSLWISGLSSVTRAVDLKITFSKYGKVNSRHLHLYPSSTDSCSQITCGFSAEMKLFCHEMKHFSPG